MAGGSYGPSVVATGTWLGPVGVHRQRKDSGRIRDVANGSCGPPAVATWGRGLAPATLGIVGNPCGQTATGLGDKSSHKGEDS